MSEHYDYERIRELLDDAHDHITHVKLKKGETTWNPVHPQWPLRGPGQWIYRRFPDGGVVASKLD